MRRWLAALCVALSLAMGSLCGCSNAAPAGDVSAEEPVAEDVVADGGVSLEDIEFHVTTSVLEYSDKETDPVGLIRTEPVEGLEITTEDHLDLWRIGMQHVTYLVTLGNQQGEFGVDYEVRDTHAPVVRLAAEEVSVIAGDAYDPASNVVSVKDDVEGDLSLVSEIPGALAGDPDGLVYQEGWYFLEGDFDATVPSVYFVSVHAYDNHGSETRKEFRIVVEAAPEPGPEPEPEPEPETKRAERTYILNTNTGKFHYPSCRAVKQMSDKNKLEYEGTREEVLDMGYDPCGICNP